MTFEEPTYEEYRTATTFAKVRYKYGLIVTILCWVALIIIIILILLYSNELSTHPISYTMDKFNLVSCNCRGGEGGMDYIINKTSIFYVPKG